MPLFTRELNELADYIGRATWTVFLHTAAPTNGSPNNARISAGGGSYESGASLTAGNITTATNGDIENSAAIAFGTADEAVGTVNHWSAYRGGVAVAFGTLPSTAIGDGDTFSINANSLAINGSTS